MASLPYFPFYYQDYLADTMGSNRSLHLTNEEHGAYFLLIIEYWQRKKALSEIEVNQIVGYERITDVIPRLERFFIVTKDREDNTIWIHKRIEEELIEAKEKSSKSKNAINMRWKNKRESEENNTNVLRTYYERNTIQIQNQNQIHKTSKKINKKDLVERDLGDVFNHWVSKCPDDRPRIIDNSRRKAILKMLEFFTVANLKLAIDGCSLDPFYNGERGVRIDSIEIIFKNATNVERFINLAKNPPTAKPPGNDKYDKFIAETKDDEVDKFIEILKRAELQCRYDLNIEEIKMYHKSLKMFCLRAISGAFQDFQERRTQYDGKFPKVALLIDFARENQKRLEQNAASRWDEVVRLIDMKFDMAKLRPESPEFIIINNSEYRSQLPEKFEDFLWNGKAREKFVELFLKVEEGK